MKRIVLLLTCLMVMPLVAQATELFRWVDKAGKMHYSDTPPADTTDVERLNLSSEPGQSDDLPYETRRAQENFPVTLYVGNGCGAPCTMARGLLNKRGIPFSEKLLKYKDDVEAFKKLSGFEEIPALAVGRNFLRGFQAEQWNGELDIAGYPKTAPYRAPGTPLNSPAASQVVPTGSPAQ